MQGFLNLNKPLGITSHDCVSKVRKLLHLKRVGHGGTLDPAATGVLPIALGKATRLLQFLKTNKVYQAKIRLGIVTTTDDLEGEVIKTEPAASNLTLEQIKAVLPSFLGKIEQIPPIYSAIQVQGKRLYEIARAGETIDVPVRTVEVEQIQILDWRTGDFPEVDLEIACGGGTYIRAIARDLGIALNTGGTLAALTRTQSCGFSLANSLTIEQLADQIQQGIFQPVTLNVALAHLPAITLNPVDAHRWLQGQRIKLASREDSGFVRVQTEAESLLGIGQILDFPDAPILAPKVVLD